MKQPQPYDYPVVTADCIRNGTTNSIDFTEITNHESNALPKSAFKIKNRPGVTL